MTPSPIRFHLILAAWQPVSRNTFVRTSQTIFHSASGPGM
jgi:hypothetical protein